MQRFFQLLLCSEIAIVRGLKANVMPYTFHRVELGRVWR